MRTPYDIVAAHYAASVRLDMVGMMADVSPAVEWTEMEGFPCAGTWIGPEQVIKNVFGVLNSSWLEYRFELEELVDGGATVVATGTYLGTHRITRKALRARVAHIWKVADGKIVRFEQFTDTLLVAQAMLA